MVCEAQRVLFCEAVIQAAHSCLIAVFSVNIDFFVFMSGNPLFWYQACYDINESAVSNNAL